MHDNGSATGPACADGRLLALRCLGLPQVITRAPMSRRRALRFRLAAFCARLRPGNTAELASVVLRLGEEVDMRERMLDAALRDAPSARPAQLGRDRDDGPLWHLSCGLGRHALQATRTTLTPTAL